MHWLNRLGGLTAPHSQCKQLEKEFQTVLFHQSAESSPRIFDSIIRKDFFQELLNVVLRRRLCHDEIAETLLCIEVKVGDIDFQFLHHVLDLFQLQALLARRLVGREQE